ncbi:polysaccharide deacetylase family protein [Lacinutrix sp. 5H-3-7-4]|uniref:polysaccharide deacetylase family protein n=1 Tax=Lacinutrix sp. (strain 5H-3-7-4) TaxID=983544 RepID=UPI00020A3D0A|nr:polysaccharide deacetylase family protein [Lacinutrix sp. 5H-3-7-4]AEH01933.1 polysaccharide deacetylase [Lacinutrix sp. 5H-3-7-4]
MLKRKIDIFFITVLVGGTILLFVNSFPLFVLFIWLFLWFVITALGSFNIDWNYHLKSLNSSPNTIKNQVSITFDDGPNPEFTPQVLALLKKYNAKATFFCVGKNIEANPELFKTIIAQGHTVGNHTYSHSKKFGFFKTQQVILELKQTNTVAKTIGAVNLKLYRPAFGVTNPQIKKALKKIKLQSIGWNTRSFDTSFLSSKVIIKKITKNLKKGDVILLHDSSEKSVLVLEQLLLFLHKQNLQSVTIDTLFNIKAYA